MTLAGFDIPLYDICAFVVFALCWSAYIIFIDLSRWSNRTLATSVNMYRMRWMKRLVDRENRVADTTLTTNLMRSVSFLASTSILILGGLFALFGTIDQSYLILKQLPFATNSSKLLFEIKILILSLIFVYAFFQFTWSFRQFNYFNILFGAAPDFNESEQVKRLWVKRAARLLDLAGHSFGSGLRAYYFALAMLAWFFSTTAFIIATLLVVAVQYRREFHSKTYKTLAE